MRLTGSAMLLWVLRSRSVTAFSLQRSRHAFLNCHKTRFHSSNRLSSTDNDVQPEPMANLYTGWSIEDDQMLFKNRKKSLPDLALLLGRGLRGVGSRLDKLTDVNSQAYARLFAGRRKPEEDENDEKNINNKLIPAIEVLRRIRWDYALTTSDFTVLHYDRIENATTESPMDAPNMSVKGKETMLVLAIPEHRIEAIKYKEQIVWDKENRIDRVFGSMGGKGQTIQDVMANYDEWKQQKDAAEELNRKRQIEVSSNIQAILGEHRFGLLKQLSSDLLDACKQEQASMKKKVEMYVQEILELFRDVRRDPSSSPEPTLVPTSDSYALDAFSELVALVLDSYTRPAILVEITIQTNRLDGKQAADPQDYTIPELDESELTESFVRGSGAGGQKVNKTSSCVNLLHKPTGLRVDCQDTRSLQQNRKLARKRLLLKLDEYLNGSQSKTSLKNSVASSKKSKAKARSKSRLKKKKEIDDSD